MVFKRRDRRSILRVMRETLWPKGGWGRAAKYVTLRVNRIPDEPHRIARGIFVGVFVSFTPFYGLHFGISALLAWMLRGNVVASLLATFFGNPLTYVPIGVIAMETGYWILGLEHDDSHGTLGQKFVGAGRDLWHNVLAMFGPRTPEWAELRLFYDEVFFPYLIGGLIPGVIAGLAMYYVSLPLVTAFKNRRKGALKARIAALKAKGPKRET